MYLRDRREEIIALRCYTLSSLHSGGYKGLFRQNFLLARCRRNAFHLLYGVVTSTLHLRKLFHTRASSDMPSLGATFCLLLDYFGLHRSNGKEFLAYNV